MSTKVPLYMCLSHMPSSHPHPIQTCLSHLCPSHVPLSPTHEQHLSTTKTVRGTIQTFKTHSRKFFCSKQSRSMSIKKRIYKHWCQTLHDLVLTALLQNTQNVFNRIKALFYVQTKILFKISKVLYSHHKHVFNLLQARLHMVFVGHQVHCIDGARDDMVSQFHRNRWARGIIGLCNLTGPVRLIVDAHQLYNQHCFPSSSQRTCQRTLPEL